MKQTQTQELQIFSNEEFGSIRSIKIDNEPYFIGKDVAAALGYGGGNHKSKALTNAINDHVDEEDKKLIQYSDFQGYRNCDLKNISHYGALVINESGLYSLILRSRLPSAKKFKHWVTSEVLPSLRKTGGYGNTDNFAVNKLLEQQSQMLTLLLNQQEKEQEKQALLNRPSNSRWKSRSFEKMKMLAEHFDTDLKNIMNNMFLEVNNRYDITIEDYRQECILRTGRSNPFTLDIIESVPDIQKMFDTTLNDILNRCGLVYKSNSAYATIFDNLQIKQNGGSVVV